MSTGFQRKQNSVTAEACKIMAFDNGRNQLRPIRQ